MNLTDLNRLLVHLLHRAAQCVGDVFDTVIGKVSLTPRERISRQAIEALPAAVYMTDAEGHITFYNEAAAALWGCRPTLGDSKFCGSWKLYWPDGTPLSHDECPMAMALHQRRAIRGMEAVAERPDGTRIPFIPYPTPLFDASGRLTGAVNTLVDISEHKSAEQDRQRLAAIIASSQDAIVGMDLNGIVTNWNSGAQRLFGYAAAEMIGKSITPLIPTHLRLDECDILERVARGERIEHFETIRVRKDGVLASISLSISPVRDAQGRVIGASKIARDITERKMIEQALAERSLQLALAERASLVGSLAYDPDTDTMQISDGYAAIHGFPNGTTRILRSQWQASVHPEDRERLEELRSRAFRLQSNDYRVDYRTVRPNGEVRWIDARLFISYRSDGQPQRVVGVNIDVTERKKAEDALRRRKAELAEAQRLAHIGNWSWDAGTNTLVGSDELLRIYGWDTTQPIPDSCEQRARNYPSEDWERLREATRDAMQKGTGYLLDLRAFRNGIPIWVTIRAKAVRNARGQIMGLRGTVQDITERKTAELALAERNIQLDLAAKAGLVGSYAYDTDTEMMQISEGYAAIHGYPERTAEIARCECLATVHPDDIAQVKLRRSEAFHEQRHEYNVEYRIIRPSDEIRWVETRCFISYDAVGHPKRVLGVSIDITERKQAEEHQRLLVAELDHRVKNALATVSAVSAQTMETSGSMSDFVAALDGRIRSMATAHELLSISQWHGMPLAELVRRELAAYATSNNVEIDGPEVMLSAEAGQLVAMMVHELVTNAAKYGALSTRSGRVLVRWYRKLNGSAQLVLEWQEAGGPRVEAQEKSGYGTSVVRDLIPYELGGTVDLSFAPEGVRCRLEIPLDGPGTDRRNGAGSERLHHSGRAPSALMR